MICEASEKISNARSSLTDYISNTKKSQAAVAKELGVSGSILSQFLNGTYIGSNENVAEKIYQYLAREEERKRYTATPRFTEDVINTKLVLSALNYVHSCGAMATIVGAAGCGKTTALQHYAENNSNVIYVQADATKNSPHAALKLILKEIGEKPRGTVSDILDTLINELKGTRKLIIIDEAQHLTERSFDTLRAINDRAGVAVVYAGTPDIRNRMIGRKSEELDQVYSRIGYDCELKNRYKLEEIQSVFNDFNLDKKVIKCLYNVSSRKGGLRLAINLFKLANDMATVAGEEISVKYLEIAAKHVGTGGGVF